MARQFHGQRSTGNQVSSLCLLHLSRTWLPPKDYSWPRVAAGTPCIMHFRSQKKAERQKSPTDIISYSRSLLKSSYKTPSYTSLPSVWPPGFLWEPRRLSLRCTWPRDLCLLNKKRIAVGRRLFGTAAVATSGHRNGDEAAKTFFLLYTLCIVGFLNQLAKKLRPSAFSKKKQKCQDQEAWSPISPRWTA